MQWVLEDDDVMDICIKSSNTAIAMTSWFDNSSAPILYINDDIYDMNNDIKIDKEKAGSNILSTILTYFYLSHVLKTHNDYTLYRIMARFRQCGQYSNQGPPVSLYIFVFYFLLIR